MRVAVIASALMAGACASNHHDTYRAKNPDWYGEFPTSGASVHETLAGLYAPPAGDYRRYVSKLDVLNLGEGEPVKLRPEEIDALLASDDRGTYAIVATLGCRSEVDVEIYVGEKVDWFLFRKGRLEAYDSHSFAERCVVVDEFRPGDASLAELEATVLRYRDAHFPQSMAHAGEYYRKGLVYLQRGRLDEAETMLAAGDASFDVAARGERHVHFEGPSRSVPIERTLEIERLRRTLAEKLLTARQAQ